MKGMSMEGFWFESLPRFRVVRKYARQRRTIRANVRANNYYLYIYLIIHVHVVIIHIQIIYVHYNYLYMYFSFNI